MLELVFEALISIIPQTTGRAVMYAFTLGRVRCEDGAAEVIGVVFWLLVFLVVAFLLVRG